MNKNGSAIIWVVSTLLIFMIIVGGILAMVGSSHKSALRNNYKQQAYFTALSAVRIVAEGINQGNESLTPTPTGVTFYPSMAFPTSMGSADVSAQRLIFESRDCILIRATGNYLGVNDSVSLRLYSDEETWEIWR